MDFMDKEKCWFYWGRACLSCDIGALSLESTLLREVSLRWFNLEYGFRLELSFIGNKSYSFLFRNKFFPVSGGSGPDQPEKSKGRKFIHALELHKNCLKWSERAHTEMVG